MEGVKLKVYVVSEMFQTWDYGEGRPIAVYRYEDDANTKHQELSEKAKNGYTYEVDEFEVIE